MIKESFLDYFHFDSRFFKTIIPLVFRPGYLTMEYMKGKRKSFGEPFRLFLVISIIYFFLLPFNSDSGKEDHKSRPGMFTVNRQKSGKHHFTLYYASGRSINNSGEDSVRKEIDSTGIRNYVNKNYSDANGIEKLLMRQTLKIAVYSGQSFWTIVERTASKMIFLLIPVFALLLKLIYRRRKLYYYEHLIFALHTHAFVFLVFIIALLIGFLVHVDFGIIILISLVYLFFAMRKNYGQNTGKTLRKYFLLILSYGIIAIPILFLLLILVSIILY